MDLRHPLAGVVFPSTSDGFVRGELHAYDDWGHNLSVGYEWSDNGDSPTAVTVFVYPADDWEADSEHLERAIGDVLRAHPNTELQAHARAVIKGNEGLRVDCLIHGGAAGARGLPTSILLFKVDRWFVKVRSTARLPEANPHPGDIAARLLGQLEWPHSRALHASRLLHALEDSSSSIAALELVVEAANPDEPLTATLREAAIRLRSGDWLGALESLMALEEQGAAPGTTDPLATALATYVPPAVSVIGGDGISLNSGLRFRGLEDATALVSASLAFLACALGPRSRAWEVMGAELVEHGGRIVEIIHVQTSAGQWQVVSFDVDSVQMTAEGDELLARWSVTDQATPQTVLGPLALRGQQEVAMQFLGAHTGAWLLHRDKAVTPDVLE
jgi:hypothetical protein